ncbi:MAG: hypothetical protein JSW27_00980 [Phycisphaerales bacterium]|nr:MAG: hypothetical protein JSW27_00980 [Phycisphaerales bacterium]
MNRLLAFVIVTCSITFPLGLCGGCDEAEEIVMTPEGTFTPSYLKGREVAGQYAAGELPDYAVVWSLYETRSSLRDDFLEGFAEGLNKAGAGNSAADFCEILRDSMSGNQFETARDLGTKHAAAALTNEQIQGTIHSSLGVSRGVALGWKAGYIKGFAAQRIADTAASGTVGQSRMRYLRAEAATTYNALRASIGP